MECHEEGLAGDSLGVVKSGGIGLLAAVIGVTLWTFADPANSGLAFAIYLAGSMIAYLAVLVAGVAVRSAQSGSVIPDPA